MLQVAALNAEGAVAALVGNIEDMVVYLAVGEWSVRIVYSSTSGSLGRRSYLIAQLAWELQERQV